MKGDRIYYNPLLETLKDEGENRIRMDAEFSSINEYRVEMALIPKDINICPSCGSTNVIKFGKKGYSFKYLRKDTRIIWFFSTLK